MLFRSRAVAAVVEAVEAPAAGVCVADVADPMPTGQHELASWFPGPALPVPTGLLRLLAGGLAWCGRPGRKAAGMIRKFAGFPPGCQRDYRGGIAAVGSDRRVKRT